MHLGHDAFRRAGEIEIGSRRMPANGSTRLGIPPEW